AVAYWASPIPSSQVSIWSLSLTVACAHQRYCYIFPLSSLTYCSARAPQAAAAPPSSHMNSRRLMSNIGGSSNRLARRRSDCHRHSSGRCDGRHRMVDCAGLGGRRMTSSVLPQSKAPPLGTEFSFQAQDHNALAISMVRFLVALPPSGTCYFAPNI